MINKYSKELYNLIIKSRMEFPDKEPNSENYEKIIELFFKQEAIKKLSRIDHVKILSNVLNYKFLFTEEL